MARTDAQQAAWDTLRKRAADHSLRAFRLFETIELERELGMRLIHDHRIYGLIEERELIKTLADHYRLQQYRLRVLMGDKVKLPKSMRPRREWRRVEVEHKGRKYKIAFWGTRPMSIWLVPADPFMSKRDVFVDGRLGKTLIKLAKQDA